MDTPDVCELIREEIPKVLQEDATTQALIVRLARPAFADKAETNSRFDRPLEELQRDREEQSRKWDEQNHRWEEQNRKWDESQRLLNEMLQEIRRVDRRIDTTIGALGARWGRESERAFRDAQRAILEESFGAPVINVTEFDDAGEVDGRPDQVGLDLIIKSGMLIICEIKSSMSKADMYTFARAVTFYEKRHQRQAQRRIVISPMIDQRAARVASALGIEIYSFPKNVPTEQNG